MSGTRLGCILALLFVLSLLVQVAVAKWLYERKQKRKRLEAAQAEAARRKASGPAPDERGKPYSGGL